MTSKLWRLSLAVVAATLSLGSLVHAQQITTKKSTSPLKGVVTSLKGTTLAIIVDPGEFERSMSYLETPEPLELTFEWTPRAPQQSQSDPISVQGLWEVTLDGVLMTHNVTKQVKNGEPSRFTLPKGQFLSSTSPNKRRQYKITITPINQKGERIGKSAEDVTVVHIPRSEVTTVTTGRADRSRFVTSDDLADLLKDRQNDFIDNISLDFVTTEQFTERCSRKCVYPLGPNGTGGNVTVYGVEHRLPRVACIKKGESKTAIIPSWHMGSLALEGKALDQTNSWNTGLFDWYCAAQYPAEPSDREWSECDQAVDAVRITRESDGRAMAMECLDIQEHPRSGYPVAVQRLRCDKAELRVSTDVSAEQLLGAVGVSHRLKTNNKKLTYSCQTPPFGDASTKTFSGCAKYASINDLEVTRDSDDTFLVWCLSTVRR